MGPLALPLDPPLFTGLNLVATCTPTLNLGLSEVAGGSLAGSGLRRSVAMRTSSASSSMSKGGALDWPGGMGTSQWKHCTSAARKVGTAYIVVITRVTTPSARHEP